MKENSRIRFNPVTKEIEVEGSESFVKAYFDKLQAMMSGAPEKKVTRKKEPKAVKAAPAKKAKKAAKKKPGQKRVTNIDTVVELIQGSSEGISTAELKEKTGLVELQIWSIVNRAAKLGKIKKLKKGLYVGV
jgi:hypothetical protein